MRMRFVLILALLCLLLPKLVFAAPSSDRFWGVGVLEGSLWNDPLWEKHHHPNPVGLYSASQSNVWNKAISDGWFLPLAGPFGSRGDFLPVSTSMMTTQSHMKRERHPSTHIRYVTVTIPLRRDLSWSDGSPLRAEDVAFTFQALKQLNVYTLGGNWPALFPKDLLFLAEVLDPYTVKLWLTRPPGMGEWQFGLMAVPILKKSIWEPELTVALQQEDPAGYFSKLPMQPIVLGPKMPGSSDNGRLESVLNPNDIRRYERVVLFQSDAAAISNARSRFEFRTNGARGIVGQVIEDPEPISRLIFRPYHSRAQARHALSQGEIDVLLDPLNQWDPDSVGLRILAFNLRRPATKAAALRRALSELIDRDALVRRIHEQSPVPIPVLGPTHSLVPPIHRSWHNPFVGHVGPPLGSHLRLLRAQGILTDAGYRPENMLPEDASLTIATLRAESDPVSHAIAGYIADLLAQLNIPGQILAISQDEFYPRVFGRRDFDLAVTGWRVDGGTFPHQLDLLFALEADEWNITGYDSSKHREAVRQLRRAPDQAAAQRAAWELQEILYEDAPMIPLVTIGPSSTEDSRAVWSSLVPQHNMIWLD